MWIVELFLTSPFKTYLACSWPGQQMYVYFLNSSGRQWNFLNRIPGESEICKFVIEGRLNFTYALARRDVQYLAISPDGVMLVSLSYRLQGSSNFVKTIKHGVMAITLQVTPCFKRISWTVNCHSLIFCFTIITSSGDLLIHRTQADKKVWAKPDAFQQLVFS